jgi:arylsulfatase A-like enzyme
MTVAEPRATPAIRHRDVLWLVLAAGLTAGLGEVGFRFALLRYRELLSNRVYLNPQSVWMGPLVSALILLGPVLLAYAVARRTRGGSYTWAAPVFTAAALALFSIAMITRRVSDASLAIMALGLATPLARLAHRRPVETAHWARRLALTLLAVCGVATTTLTARSLLVERRTLALRPTPGADVPNVLLLVLDTVRGMELGLGGYSKETTPNIDRWSRRGVVFDRAIAPAPWTLPTHASVFTGRWPHELDVGWSRPLGDTPQTLAERMTSLGYATGGFAANFVYCSYLFGLDRGFSVYRDYQLSPSELLGASTIGRRLIDGWNRARGSYVMVGRKSAAEVNAEFLSWERRTTPAGPWFAFINYFDAHDPYDPEAPYREQFPGTEEKYRSLAVLRARPPEELHALQAAYDGALASLDAEVGRLLDDLERRGVLDNTMVIITSDHGEEFGEHGHTGHGSSLFTPVLHVPLVVLPARDSVTTPRVRRFVSLRDLAATIEGAARPSTVELPGSSLRPLWRGDSAAVISPAFSAVDRLANLPDRYPVSKTNLRSLIVDDRWHLIRSDEGREQLFDLSSDFMETTDLAGRPEHSALVQRLRDSLQVLSGRTR